MRPEPAFDFRAIVRELNRRGIRYLVFGRQAMRALGSPVLTQDYDVNRERTRLDFDELFARSSAVGDPDGVGFRVPSIDDMIALKRMGAEVRPKDEEDIRYLQVRRELIAQGRLPPR